MLGRLALRLQEQHRSHRYRQRSVVTDNKTQKSTHQAINFCSNDYLELTQHPSIIQAFQQGAEQYGVGAGASALVSGYTDAHHELELAFADWMGCERALLFGNGYMANLGVISTLAQRHDLVCQDRENHASLIDGVLLANTKSFRFNHNQLDSLEARLREHNRSALLISDSVFSMSGRLVNLAGLLSRAEAHQASLIIDDAHGIGWLGKSGRGICEHSQVNINQLTALVCPLGKAFGGYGAMVCGSNTLIEALTQFARSYMYTTALPPAMACGLLASLRVIQQESWRRQRLQDLIAYFTEAIKKYNLPISPSKTPIQTCIINNPEQVIAIQAHLQQAGYQVAAIRPPTVKQSLLRLSLTTAHDEQLIDGLLDQLALLLD